MMIIPLPPVLVDLLVATNIAIAVTVLLIAMDGASKFVKGDAIAGLVIVAINLVGGIAMGRCRTGSAPGTPSPPTRC